MSARTRVRARTEVRARTVAIRGDAAWWVAAAGASVFALTLRGVGQWSWIVVAAGGVVGLAVPLQRAGERSITRWTLVTLAGVAVFVLARSFSPIAASGGLHALVIGAVAGVCEEALFRRGLYGYFERWGSMAAVLMTAVLFGLVHVPMYGWRALPIDVGAGLVFGWQRWATGSWTSAGATHALANVAQYL